MFGWSIRARACRSASNRAITSRRVHPRLDDLQGHPAADRLGLLGDVDHAHPALADLLQQLVRADHRAGGLRRRAEVGGQAAAASAGRSRKLPARKWAATRPFDPPAEGRRRRRTPGPGRRPGRPGRRISMASQKMVVDVGGGVRAWADLRA